ncbi:MAG: CorA family divalent cation transporter [Planctomycetota bacterium]
MQEPFRSCTLGFRRHTAALVALAALTFEQIRGNVRTMENDLQVHAIRFDLAARSSQTFGLDQLEQEIAGASVFVWVDLQGREIDDLHRVLRRLRVVLPPVAAFDRAEVLPRIVEQADCLSFDLYEVEDPELHLDTTRGLSEIRSVRMMLLLGAHFIVTFHQQSLAIIREVRATCDESFRAWGKTPGFLAFLLLQRCLYDYAQMNLANDNYLDRLDRLVLTGDQRELAEGVSLARRNILMLKKLGASLEIILMVLASKKSLFVSDESRTFYQEMLRTATSVRSAIDSSRDLLDGIVGSIEAEASHRTSDVARVLTVVSTIMLPLGLITGVYGMNFHNMPELAVPWAYHAVLIGMVLISVAIFWVFHRLGWIGRFRKKGQSTLSLPGVKHRRR